MNIIGLRKIWYSVSAVLILPGVIALIIWGLKPSIDFSGGTLLELQFPKQAKVTTEAVRGPLEEAGFINLNIQNSQENTVIIRTVQLDNKRVEEAKKVLSDKLGEVKELRLQTIGPTVSKDLTKKAFISLIVASIAIILYVAFAFRKVPRPASSWRFGVCAVIALIHDALFITGLFAILGHFLGIEVDSLFITAVLTIIGFSVHDTIVVFDRIRENLRKYPEYEFEEVANASVNQTLDRSINTSFTVILVLLALYFFGGESIKYFVLALIIGVAIGTYSSIFNASALLVSWEKFVRGRAAQKAEVKAE
jgi:preprotein translocase subunit SecF